MTTQNKLLAEIKELDYSSKNSKDKIDKLSSQLRLDQCKKDIALFKEMLNQYEKIVTDEEGYIKIESDAIIKYFRKQLDEAEGKDEK